VWFNKSTANEKRLVFIFAQMLDCPVGGVIVAVTFTIAVQDNNAIGIACTAQVLRKRRRGVSRFLRRRTGRKHHIFTACATGTGFSLRGLGVGLIQACGSSMPP